MREAAYIGTKVHHDQKTTRVHWLCSFSSGILSGPLGPREAPFMDREWNHQFALYQGPYGAYERGLANSQNTLDELWAQESHSFQVPVECKYDRTE